MLVPFCLLGLIGSGQVPYFGIPMDQFSTPSFTGFLEKCILREMILLQLDFRGMKCNSPS